MAGSRIKGITVEIGGDTTKLQTALKGVNAEIKNTQSQLKDVEKLLKLDPGNTELLAQKQKLLSSAVSETKEKLATLKTAAEQANQALADGDISKEQYNCFFHLDYNQHDRRWHCTGHCRYNHEYLERICVGFRSAARSIPISI